MTLFFSIVYVAAITAANLLVAHFGPWFSLVNSFLLIGLDFSLRDRLHDRLGVWRVLGLVLLAGALAYLTNPAAGHIAVASAVSFILSNAVDTGVYHRLAGRPWFVRSNASNVGAAAIDSVVFPWLAFGALMPGIVVGQFGAKLLGGAIWSLILRRAA